MPSPRSPQAQRLRRKRLLSWVPTTIVALLCIVGLILSVAAGFLSAF